MLEQMRVQQVVSKVMSRTKAAVLATVGTYVVKGLLSYPHTSQHIDKVVLWLIGNGQL
jgi:TetR/AcrR family transcriptional regulator of autoinduction and epiphytic fitness